MLPFGRPDNLLIAVQQAFAGRKVWPTAEIAPETDHQDMALRHGHVRPVEGGFILTERGKYKIEQLVARNGTQQPARPVSSALGKEFLVLLPLLLTTLAVTYDVAFFSGINIELFSFFSLSEHIVFALQATPLALFFAFLGGLTVYIEWFYRTTSTIWGRFFFLLGGLLMMAFVWGYLNGLAVLYPNFFRIMQVATTIETKRNGSIEARLIRSGDRGVLFVDMRNNQVTLLPWEEIRQINTAQ
jgi:hypothetical protein